MAPFYSFEFDTAKYPKEKSVDLACSGTSIMLVTTTKVFHLHNLSLATGKVDMPTWDITTQFELEADEIISRVFKLQDGFAFLSNKNNVFTRTSEVIKATGEITLEEGDTVHKTAGASLAFLVLTAQGKLFQKGAKITNEGVSYKEIFPKYVSLPTPHSDHGVLKDISRTVGAVFFIYESTTIYTGIFTGLPDINSYTSVRYHGQSSVPIIQVFSLKHETYFVTNKGRILVANSPRYNKTYRLHLCDLTLQPYEKVLDITGPRTYVLLVTTVGHYFSGTNNGDFKTIPTGFTSREFIPLPGGALPKKVRLYLNHQEPTITQFTNPVFELPPQPQ